MDDRWAVKMADQIIKSRMPLYTADTMQAKHCMDMLVIYRAFTRVYRGSSDRKYLQFCRDNIIRQLNRDYSIRGLDLKTYKISNYSIGKPLLDLYRQTNDIKLKRSASLIYAKLKKHPKNAKGAFIHQCGKGEGVRAEGIYFSVPFYTECIRSIDNKMIYGNVINQFLAYARLLKDEKTGLFHQGYDAGAKWADKESGKSKELWACATGYYAMALADCLDCIGERVYDRKHLKDMAAQLCKALFNTQDKSGCWYHIIDSPERKGNFLESTASCMFLYFLCVCFRLRVIDGSEAVQVINNAHDGIIDEFVEITKSGSININKCSQYIELDEVEKDGSFTHYVSEPILSNELRSMGAFMLAMNEYSRVKYALKKQIY